MAAMKTLNSFDEFTKRKRSGGIDSDVGKLDDEAVCKKKRINFHNIADLIGSSDNQEKNYSAMKAQRNPESNTKTVVSPFPRCLTPQSLDGNSNHSLPETGDANFQMVSTEDFVSDYFQRPPSLTPPTTPVPDMESCIEDKKSTEVVGVKKARTMYKTEQIYILEQVFSRTQYPDTDVVEVLSKQLDISEAKIKVWFQNKRARWRRRSNETSNDVNIPTSFPTASQIAFQPYGHMLPPFAHLPVLAAPSNDWRETQMPFHVPVPVGFRGVTPANNLPGALSLPVIHGFRPQFNMTLPNLQIHQHGLQSVPGFLSVDKRPQMHL